ncbi:hypothetical protein FOMPIDRAFT_61017 [Fomitopsis schrenkii]|uniref:Major facilitator superfamily (MFS) profile domain-containing protein n=1 Tax=Fomitopsis schrenkii TaxID=2126942 RepID=S8DQH8_FOMSC|nr:hypothetical protein FOMPIDRAFT_61017 [Fomitopsis schrenkii]
MDPADTPAAVVDGGCKEWLTVFGAFLALFCSFGQLNAFGTFQTWYADHQLSHLSPSTISWIGSLQLFVFFFSGGFVGRLYDEYGPRVLMIPGTIILVSGTMLTSVSHLFYHFLLAQGVYTGIGIALLFYPSVAAVSAHFHRRRGRAVGIAMAGSGVGGLVYPIMFRQFFPQVGFGWGIRISGFIDLVLCGIALCAVTAHQSDQTESKPLFSMKTLKDMKDSRYILLVVASVFISFGLFIPNFYIVDYAAAHGLSSTTSFYVLAVLNAASIPGRLLPPYLSDRLGHYTLIVPCAFLSGVLALALWMCAHTPASILAFAALYGFFSGGFNALIIPCVAEISGSADIGTRVGMLYTSISLSSMAGGPAAGALLRHMGGSYVGVIALSGAVIVVGSFVLVGAKVCIDLRARARV